MLYDPIQGRGQDNGDLKCEVMDDFKRYLLCQCACCQNTNGELWYSKTTSKC